MASKMSDNASDEIIDTKCCVCVGKNITREAEKYCVECQDYYCIPCSDTHKTFPLIRGHKLLDKADFCTRGLQSSLRCFPTETCLIHEAKVSDIYCKNHDEVVCATCVAINHRACEDIHSITDEVDDLFKQSASDQTKKQLIAAKKDVEDIKKIKQQLLGELKKQKKNATNSIANYRKKLEAKIKRLEAKLHKEVYAEYISKERELQGEIKEAQKHIDDLEQSATKLQTSYGNRAQEFVCVKTAQKAIIRSKSSTSSFRKQTQIKITVTANMKTKWYFTQLKSLGQVSTAETYKPRTTAYNVSTAETYKPRTTAYKVSTAETYKPRTTAYKVSTAETYKPRTTAYKVSTAETYKPRTTAYKVSTAETYKPRTTAYKVSTAETYKPRTTAYTVSTAETYKPRTTAYTVSTAETYKPITTAYTVKQQRDIDIQFKEDKYTECRILGSCFTEDGSLLLTDNYNDNLKCLDLSTDTIIDHLDMEDEPIAVCMTSKQEAAVSLNNRTIQFVSLGDKMAITRKLKMNHYCFGLTFNDGKLFISDSDKKVYIHDISGIMLHKITTHKSGKPIFSKTRHISLSTNRDCIYVANGNNGLITLDIQGNYRSTFIDPDIEWPQDVCTDMRGNILVCGWGSSNIVQISEVSKTKLNIIKTDSTPLSVSFDPHHNKLVVTYNKGNIIKVYQLE